ncbi:FKBP-type peptidyl-prolyl cis-trans isomerase [Hirschia maritima]|uniref:FKBP-type peptidyl-prolyl cis-trans isomerase n=1 Tax=Hirschia maritima TaxID=1121961 RepID=UPI000365DF28|nr:FKBP-type peptidyl-prolyl cis-trans isomerase [Hirschia maritima]
MLKRVLLSLITVFFVAACTGNKSPEISLTDPFETVIPWDESHSDIIKTDSGLQYIVLKSGDKGGVKPLPSDQVVVHYDGRLAANGNKFDSSYDRGAPATFPAGGLIPGWVEALQLMTPGDEWMVFIPSDLGYGEHGAGGDIPPNADLVFRVSLEDVIEGPKPIAVDETIWAKYAQWPEGSSEVQKTESGLQYVILKSGDENGISPTPNDKVVAHYDGRLASNGEKFDSSFDRGEPATFPAGGLIPGWVEALQLMKPGDEWMLYVPSELGYGDQGAGGAIPPNADLMFMLHLNDVLVSPKTDEAAWSKYANWPTDSEEVIKTESGLQYIILESGDPSGTSPKAEDMVDVHYEGRLAADGKMFDSSFQRGESAQFPAGRLIKGWVEGLQLMKPGDRWLMYIPYDLAYGEAGRPPVIPEKADLMFEVMLNEVN